MKCSSKRRGIKRQKPPPGKSLASRYPRVAQDWHPTKNAPLTPHDIFAKSEKSRWWLCEHGHEEQQIPKRRVKGVVEGGCSICSGRTVLTGVNDLATTHPHLAALWNTEKNDLLGLKVTEVSAGSEREAWWTCRAGHEVFVSVKRRVKAAGCSKCHIVGRSRVEIDISCELTAAGVPIEETPDTRWMIDGERFQLDVAIPEWKLVIEFDGRKWHTGKAKERSDREKTERLERRGWTVIRARDRLNPLTSRDVVVDSNEGSLSIVKALVEKMRVEGFTVPRIDEYLASESLWAEGEANRKAHHEREKSLLSEHPDVAAEFDHLRNDGLLPASLHPGTNRAVYWRCSVCDNTWKAAVAERTGDRKSGCPKCKGRNHAVRRRTPKEGASLADEFPNLIEEWDYDRNDKTPLEYRPYSFSRVWWKCPANTNHYYESVIASRSRLGNGCPICDGKKVLSEDNDLATTNPDLLPMWNYEKNERLGISPEIVKAGSDKKAYWNCRDCGAPRLLKMYSVLHGSHRCKPCGLKRGAAARSKCREDKSIAHHRPGLLAEWDAELNEKDGLSPWTTAAQSHKRVAWHCPDCDHRWRVSVQSRYAGNRCPGCHRNHC